MVSTTRRSLGRRGLAKLSSLGGVLLFGSGAVACSAILGFDDRTLDPNLASGTEGGTSDTGSSGIVEAGSDQFSGEAGPKLAAPTDVVASKVEAVGDVKTFAGSVTGTPGYVDAQGVAAAFKNPYGLVVDSLRNLWVADAGNARLRRITPSGQVTTVAGSGVEGYLDATGLTAKFFTPGGLSLDASGNLFIPEYGNNRIRMMNITTAVVTTLSGNGTLASADGTSDVASFYQPITSAMDANGNLYVADFGGNRIRKVTPTGTASTIAGTTAGYMDGPGETAMFSTPAGIAVTPDGSTVYVSDNGNNLIRKITPLTNDVSTFVGATTGGFADGKGTAAGIKQPTGMALEPKSGDVYFCDSGNSRLRRMTKAGVVTTLAGQDMPGLDDGKGPLAKFSGCQGVALDKDLSVYVADYASHRIRHVNITGIGYLDVGWTPPAAVGNAPLTGFTATASASGQPSMSCKATPTVNSKCTIVGLTSGVSYTVTVTASSALETSPASKVTMASTAIPN